MKEATGELNMTVVTIVLIGVIAAFFAIFWPRVIQPAIERTWNENVTGQDDVKDNINVTPDPGIQGVN